MSIFQFSFRCVILALLTASPVDWVLAQEAGQEMTITLPGGVPMVFCYIPSGKFSMGNTYTEKTRQDDEGPQHEVTISKPFWMAKHEVTQKQWQAVMGNNPSYFKGDDLPVDRVSWDDCQQFIGKLNQLGKEEFRLPTEAEWEYACRAGTTTRFYWGEDLSETEIGSYAWYCKNSGAKTHSVKQKRPNNWGLHDMSGNVYEWCDGQYGPYSSGAEIDPKSEGSGELKVFRGGSLYYLPRDMRSANRRGSSQDRRDSDLGFRPVCAVGTP
ncbi:MAG: formylglycine-generating enzyme family protein [bacterium]